MMARQRGGVQKRTGADLAVGPGGTLGGDEAYLSDPVFGALLPASASNCRWVSPRRR